MMINPAILISETTNNQIIGLIDEEHGVGIEGFLMGQVERCYAQE